MLVKERSPSQAESDAQHGLLKTIRQQQRVSGKMSGETEMSHGMVSWQTH
jgi:hypothetical protein